MTDDELQQARALLEMPTWDSTDINRRVAPTLERLLDEVERLRGDEATMKLSRMLGLGDPVRPDIHARALRDIDKLRAELERMRSVFEAAKRWRSRWGDKTYSIDNEDRAMREAVDDAIAKETP